MHPLKSDQSNVFVNYSTRVDLNDSPPLPPPPSSYKQRHQSWPPYFRSLAPGNESRLYQQREGGKGFSDLYLLPFEDIRANRSGRVPGILRIKPANDERKGVTSASGLTTGIDNVAERYTGPGQLWARVLFQPRPSFDLSQPLGLAPFFLSSLQGHRFQSPATYFFHGKNVTSSIPPRRSPSIPQLENTELQDIPTDGTLDFEGLNLGEERYSP